MYFCVFKCLVCVRLVFVFVLLLCFYMCFYIWYLFAEVRGLDILYFCCFVFLEAFMCYVCLFICCVLCVCLVYLSFCIYNRTTTYNNRNTWFPSRNLRDIYSRSGPGLDILYFCCFMFFSKLVCLFLCCLNVCLDVCFCFRLVLLSVCVKTTQHTTLNTNKLEMALFMACVKCSK